MKRQLTYGILGALALGITLSGCLVGVADEDEDNEAIGQSASAQKSGLCAGCDPPVNPYRVPLQTFTAAPRLLASASIRPLSVTVVPKPVHHHLKAETSRIQYDPPVLPWLPGVPIEPELTQGAGQQ
jgi:hypothetical protein